MAIAGETIDYGPCAFMDTYDPDTVFSSIDHQGRYRYSNQPPIAHWNLTRLAETLLPLFSDDQDEAVDMAKEELHAFASQFEACYTRRMCQKLGLFTTQNGEVPASDQLLAIDLLQLMLNHESRLRQHLRAPHAGHGRPGWPRSGWYRTPVFHRSLFRLENPMACAAR